MIWTQPGLGLQLLVWVWGTLGGGQGSVQGALFVPSLTLSLETVALVPVGPDLLGL
jgi:hypothetical protein